MTDLSTVSQVSSLPRLCIRWQHSIEVARKLLMRRPDLQVLGTRVGNCQAYTPAEAEKLRAALDEHAARVRARKERARASA